MGAEFDARIRGSARHSSCPRVTNVIAPRRESAQLMRMATLLRYRSYGGQPFCEVMLENGDRVRITVEALGVTIKREARRDTAEEILFLGPVHLVTDICM